MAGKQPTAKEIIEAKKKEVAERATNRSPRGGHRINNIQIEGILHTPDFSVTATGKEIFKCRLDVAQGTDTDGNWKPRMVFWVTMWHNDGENDQEFVDAISLEDEVRVVAEGRLSLREYENKAGEKKQAWQITVTRITETTGSTPE